MAHKQGIVWNGMEISVWNMEDARMEWTISRMKWKIDFKNEMEDFKNGMEVNLSYQFQTRFRALCLQKNIYGCWVAKNNIVTEIFNLKIIGYYLSTNRGRVL